MQQLIKATEIKPGMTLCFEPVTVQKDIGLVWKSGQHQYLPVCKMLCEQAVFDALKYRIEVDEDGTRRYYNTAGQRHRTDDPAVEWADGTRFWYQNGQLHRTDGHAVEYADGSKFWYQNGQRHRTDDPAVEWANGEKWWYKDGLLHRTDGPAVKWADGDEFWYINDRMMTEDEFNQAVKDYE